MMEKIFKNPIYRENCIPILSFIIGTLILLTYALTEISDLIFLGLVYVIIASLINLIYSVFLIYTYYKNIKTKENSITRIGITLCNIPITLFYIYLVFNVIH